MTYAERATHRSPFLHEAWESMTKYVFMQNIPTNKYYILDLMQFISYNMKNL